MFPVTSDKANGGVLTIRPRRQQRQLLTSVQCFFHIRHTCVISHFPGLGCGRLNQQATQIDCYNTPLVRVLGSRPSDPGSSPGGGTFGGSIERSQSPHNE